MFKQKIIKLLSQTINLPEEIITNLIETPPNPNFGDYSFPCFVLSDPKNYDKMWEDVEKGFFTKKNPSDIASHLKDKILSEKPESTLGKFKIIFDLL